MGLGKGIKNYDAKLRSMYHKLRELEDAVSTNQVKGDILLDEYWAEIEVLRKEIKARRRELSIEG